MVQDSSEREHGPRPANGLEVGDEGKGEIGQDAPR